jgi:hypothetical protein
MRTRHLVTLEDLAERLAWGLYRHASLLGFPKRRPGFDLQDCKVVARAHIKHLERSGVEVDQIYRTQALAHSYGRAAMEDEGGAD